jgi:hypothetical protein
LLVQPHKIGFLAERRSPWRVTHLERGATARCVSLA